MPTKLKRLLVIGYCCGFPAILRAQSDSTPAMQKPLAELKSLLPAKPQLPTLAPFKLLDGGRFLKFDQTTARVGYSMNADTSRLTQGHYANSRGILDYDFSGGLALKNIPFNYSLDANNGFYQSANTDLHTFYKTNFDPVKYKDMLKTQVLAKISPDVVLGAINSRIEKVRAEYEGRLKQKLNGLQEEVKRKGGGKLPLPENITDLSREDFGSLESSVLNNERIAKHKANLERYQQLMDDRSQSSAVRDSVMNQLQGEIAGFEAVAPALAEVKAMKEKFENNSVVKELKSHLPFTPDTYRQFLSKPGNLESIVKNYGNLSGIQKLFTSISKLDIGQNPTQGGDLGLANLMNSGVNTGFESKKFGGGFIAGTQRNTNPWLQSGLMSSTTNEYSGLTGITFGNGAGRMLDQSLSVNFFNFLQQPGGLSMAEMMQPDYLANGRRQDAVITFHNGYEINDKHTLNVDLSKSFGSYQNQGDDQGNVSKENATQDVFKDKGRANFAAAVDYSGEVFQTGVTAGFKKVGLGYSNPGNVFLRRGETQATLGLTRKLYRNKLTIKYRGDYRQQHFDPERTYVYNSFSNKLQAAYRFRRNTRFGLTYQNTQYQTSFANKATQRGAGSMLQANGSYGFELFQKPAFNSFSLTRQSITLPVVIGDAYSSTSLLFVHNTTMMLGTNNLTVTLMGNASNNRDFYFNTSFYNLESSYAFALGKMLRLSSGAGYYVNQGWNTQIGARQSLTASLKKMDIDISVEGKRALTMERPELANQLFITSGLYYRF